MLSVDMMLNLFIRLAATLHLCGKMCTYYIKVGFKELTEALRFSSDLVFLGQKGKFHNVTVGFIWFYFYIITIK